jgi:hypothetical protein
MSGDNGFREQFLEYKKELDLLLDTRLKVHSQENYMKFTSRDKVSDDPLYERIELCIDEKPDGYTMTFILPHKFSSRKEFEEAIRVLKQQGIDSTTGLFKGDHGGILQDYRFHGLDFFVARDFLDDLFVFNLVDLGRDQKEVFEKMKNNIGIVVEFYGMIKK